MSPPQTLIHLPATARVHLCGLGVLLLGACNRGQSPGVPVAPASQSAFEYKLISSGDNFPGIDLQRDSLGQVEIALHRGVSVAAMESAFGWSDSALTRRLELLRRNDLAHRDEKQRWRAGVMVMMLGDTGEYLRVDPALVAEAADSIDARELAALFPGVSRLPFARVSLFLLSDVLLDNWQIENVERRWIGADRPLRGGKRFYFSIQEKPRGQVTEAFGIYGNAYRTLRSAPVDIGVYGNQRNHGTLLTIGLSDSALGRIGTVAALAGMERDRRISNGQTLSADDTARLVAVGIFEHGQVAAPIFTAADDARLSSLAEGFAGSLVGLLSREDSRLRRKYESSPYAGEVTFAEYKIWWYHLFYSRVTDRLMADGSIQQGVIPNVTYFELRP